MTAPVKIRRTEDEYIIDPLKVWIGEMEKWGQRVRDDIMALEDAVIQLDGKTGTGKIDNPPFRPQKPGGRAGRYKPENPGGDPGDPPQDPFD